MSTLNVNLNSNYVTFFINNIKNVVRDINFVVFAIK